MLVSCSLYFSFLIDNFFKIFIVMADDYSDDEDEEEDDHEQIELKEIQISFKTFEEAEVVARDEEEEMLQEAEDVLCFEKPNTRKGYFDIIKKLIILMAKDDVICSDDDTDPNVQTGSLPKVQRTCFFTSLWAT